MKILPHIRWQQRYLIAWEFTKAIFSIIIRHEKEPKTISWIWKRCSMIFCMGIAMYMAERALMRRQNYSLV